MLDLIDAAQLAGLVQFFGLWSITVAGDNSEFVSQRSKEKYFALMWQFGEPMTLLFNALHVGET